MFASFASPAFYATTPAKFPIPRPTFPLFIYFAAPPRPLATLMAFWSPEIAVVATPALMTLSNRPSVSTLTVFD